ncbi:MAG: ATP-binding protein [Paludibacter sp.]|nr:ATP-binding protein [Paludibacter sp.]
MHNRHDVAKILKKAESKFGRILVLTGARQTGKTTLVRRFFADYTYISIEDPVMRKTFADLTAQQWKTLYPKAILDEVQKEPQLIESIKSTYDQWDEPRYILLGSSQLLLMEKVRESLAGRCTIVEIFPLTLPELKTTSWDDAVRPSLFQQELTQQQTTDYLPSYLLDKDHALKQKAYDHYLRFGAYPAVSGDDTTGDEKINWLQNYVRTYLERDVRDLASFRDLEPFVQLQQYLALNTGSLTNASSIGKQLGITSKTVQRYITYFEMSYQAFTLPSWSRNQNKRLVKASKVHYMDQGVIQAVLKKQGGLTGNEYESALISELYKQAKSTGLAFQLSFLRTHDGKEVDLLIEFQDYYYAFEIKMAEKVNHTDARHLFRLDEILDKPIKKAFLLSNDLQTKYFDEKTIAIHAAYFLG